MGEEGKEKGEGRVSRLDFTVLLPRKGRGKSESGPYFSI